MSAPRNRPPVAVTVTFRVNGRAVEVVASPMKRLLDVLREELSLTGTKYGCGEGECGACTVLLDGEAVMSCLVPVIQVGGREVRTVEGLAPIDAAAPAGPRSGPPRASGAPGTAVLSELQRAFLELGGAQCGICTPGMLMMAAAHLERGGALDDASLREALAGNICRCTGYTKILEAVRRAGESRARSRGPEGPKREPAP